MILTKFHNFDAPGIKFGKDNENVRYVYKKKIQNIEQFLPLSSQKGLLSLLRDENL